MGLKSISVTFLGTLVLSAAPVFAKDSCESNLRVSDLSVPSYRRATISPGKFQSKWRNRLALWWNRKNLVEIPNVPVRTQCFGTCYLYSTQTVLETALKAQKILQPGDYLVNFISDDEDRSQSLSKIAFERHRSQRNRQRWQQ